MKIKNKLFELVFNISCEQHIKLFFKNYQSKLIELSNLLYDLVDADSELIISPLSKNELLQNTRMSFLFIIDDLISHAQFQFSIYFDDDCLIPNKLRDVAKKQFDCLLADFYDLNTCIPTKLIEIITDPVIKFISDPLFSTYRNLSYLKKFTSELSEIKENTENSHLFSSIKIKLFYLNYNAVSFFNFITDEIIEEVTKIDTNCGKIEKLSWFLKHTNQLPQKPGLAFPQGQKSIQNMVSHWIIEEIYHLEKSIQLSISYNKNSLNELSDNFKIITDLSVSQLAYLLKILIETDILKNQNDRELIKFIAVNTRTKKAETISPESLQVKFYNVEENTKDEMKSFIIKLLNHINKSKNVMIPLYILSNYVLLGFDIIPLASCG